ncbi:RIP metalloprotease RseP [[Eubacterium] yurii subsp. margaretiae ATCC 43715]|nr:RIP metalloprotease RseP [[Eubacterium] yurii subsp. margaretiae ATCC 43715]
MGIINIIIALLIFGLVVAVHEFGHFFVAKLNKITVHEFAIGMGPVVFQKEKNGTNYSIRAIPMGGFVAMEGEDEESDDPNAFCQKNPLQKMAVVFAGPFMNFVLTIVTFILLFTLSGVPVNKVGNIIENSPASKSELKVGDEIKSINGISIKSWNDIPTTIAGTKGDVTLQVIRDGQSMEITITPEEKSGRRTVGIYPMYEKNFSSSISQAFSQTYSVSLSMLDFIKKLFTGKVDFNYVSGPVGIVKEMGSSVNSGLATVINYIAFISLNLGIMNLLPIPALDGFRLLTSFVELITRKKLNKKMEYIVNAAGMIFLIGIMLLVTYKDLIKIFTGQ